MKLRSFLILFSLILTGIVSCKKESVVALCPEGSPAPTTYVNYAMLDSGNYWIYERYSLDSAGNETPSGITDSIYVKDDTIISGQTYFILVKPAYPSSGFTTNFLRDSLHYIVDFQGRIHFSSEDFTTILKSGVVYGAPPDTVYTYEYRMVEKDLPDTVPSGIYITSNFRNSIVIYPPYETTHNPRFLNQRYAQGVGIVSETINFFVGIPMHEERRLLRYHLE